MLTLPTPALQLPVGGNWIDFSQIETVYPTVSILPVAYWRAPMWSRPAPAKWEVEFILIPTDARAANIPVSVRSMA